MKTTSFFLLVFFSTTLLFSEPISFPNLQSPEAVANYFPKNASEMISLRERTLATSYEALTQLRIEVRKKNTFKTSVLGFDELLGYVQMQISRAEALTLVSPDAQLREEALKTLVTFNNFLNDLFSKESRLFLDIKKCVEKNQANLSSNQLYLAEQILWSFEMSGQSLTQEDRVEILAVQKEIEDLEQNFKKNIQEDNSHFYVSKEHLEGLKPAQFDSFSQNEEGLYRVSCSYPDYFAIMTTCTNADTRKELVRIFSNIAYPNNNEVLTQLIEKRDELANKLGYESYSHLILSNEMVKTPKRARSFLEDLWTKASEKEAAEFKAITADLPDHVNLTSDGKLKSWDSSYVFNYHKKKNYNLDNEQIAEYFPFDSTFKGLMGIYEQFFNIQIQEESISGLWHEDVQLLKISEADNTLIGYILLDLFPRENKYSHACDVPGVALGLKRGKETTPTLDLVVANFTKPTETTPSLLKHREVTTLFHEFGHAMHDLFAKSEYASFAGIATPFLKIDFVELPSQMLEEWMWDAQILKQVSCHYKTQKPLPDSLIQTLIQSKSIASGSSVQGQCYLSFLSLNYFSEGRQKDASQIAKDLRKQLCPHYESLEENHGYLSFGHLTEYGPRYYGYLWSKVFALDLFSQIKEEGLLNPTVGIRYRKTILEKGASEDPNKLLFDFLGREPNQEAFIKDLGL